MKRKTEHVLTVLGAGTPTPTATRFGTAYVLQMGADHLLFDCGPATTHKLVQAGMRPTMIDYLFLTHHHSDHNADCPCFLLCRWDQSTGKEHTLKVYGPPPTKAFVDKLIGPDGAFAPDWKARVGAPLSQNVHTNRGGNLPRPVPAIDVRDIGLGDCIEGNGWRVSAGPAHHVEPWLTSLSYRVDTDRGSIVFAGDTGPSESLTAFARGTRVFVANCWDHQDTMDADGEAPGQTGTRDAARFARETGAQVLVLTHTGPALCRPGSREKAIRDIAAEFDGEIIFSEEGLRLPL